MGYRKAEEILPEEIIKIIQQYVDGEMVYIPRKEGTRKEWGHQTQTRKQLHNRNQSIYNDYKQGMNVRTLAEKYYLSEKSIQRILHEMKHAA
ncbi:MAG: CD3324 family protein [bacterium]|nr:CD3324 family protein [bacterium]